MSQPMMQSGHTIVCSFQCTRLLDQIRTRLALFDHADNGAHVTIHVAQPIQNVSLHLLLHKNLLWS